MGTKIETNKDIVSFLKQQHEQVKGLFTTVLSTAGKEREKAFVELRRMLAVHETAEEEIVHPVARRTLADGEAVVRARLQEENTAKKALAELEKMDVDSAEFERNFRQLRDDVIAHATSEEKEEFERLGQELEPKELQRMRKAAELAEAIAPTRPHPGIESQAANMIAGPFAAMIDRTRDAITGKS